MSLAGLASLGPSLDDGEGAAAGYVAPTGPATSHGRGGGAGVDQVQRRQRSPPPKGIVQFNYSGATGHTLAIQDPKFDGFLLTTDAGGPKAGKVELAAGQVHPLLHRARPRGRRA